MSTTGNQALDALVDVIAQRLCERLTAALGQNRTRLIDVAAAAEYIGRSRSAVRHLIAKGTIPCVRRDGRVQLDRQDLDNWLELGKARR
jgi:excisionase family DNA binding protein